MDILRKNENIDENLIVGIDFEWTKNYKIKNGNKPFCFSIIYFPESLLVSKVRKGLRFGFESHYIINEKEIPLLLKNSDRLLAKILKSNSIIVGHQLSSDISVVLSNSNKGSLKAFEILRDKWRNRKNDSSTKTKVFDTRYDLNDVLQNKSRRLVDVCEEAKLDVKQPELLQSMTKMQNVYYESQDKSVSERLAVLNIRHSLSSALLFYFFNKRAFSKYPINVNQILYKNLKQYFSYVQSEDFSKLL